MTAAAQAHQRSDARSHEPAADFTPLAAWVQSFILRWRSVGLLGLSEARLAALGLSAMFFFAALAALLCFTVWILLNALIAALLASTSLTWSASFAALIVANALGAWLCWRRVFQLTRHLEFPITRGLLATEKSRHVSKQTAEQDSPAPGDSRQPQARTASRLAGNARRRSVKNVGTARHHCSGGNSWCDCRRTE